MNKLVLLLFWQGHFFYSHGDPKGITSRRNPIQSNRNAGGRLCLFFGRDI